ncbi:MAG: hypothetical protein Q8859_08460, partial [Bacteroidota bacterium]|nr:hypothetical protein [Bacteroidota bacterium]
ASGFIMIVVFALNKFTHRWTKRKVIYSILTLLLGIAIQASSLENYGFWILSGTVVGGALLVSYIVFLRYHFTWIPLVGVVPVILGMIRIAISDQYHATTGGAILGIIIISWIAMKWHKLLQNN